MTLKEKVIELLQHESGKFLSGEEIANELNVSRTAVWKTVKELQNNGLQITAVTNKGYCLSKSNDVLTIDGIKDNLCKQNIFNIKIFESVTSTNTILRDLAQNGAPEWTIVISSCQTKGRGRFGRHFYSPDDSGIYLSILIKPTTSAKDATLITTAAAVAVCDATEKVSGRKCGIKWVNDVLIDDKKICGILTEAAIDVESGCVEYAIVGIGINAYEPANGFYEEIKDIAGPVFLKKESNLKNKLTAEIINSFYKYYNNISDKTYLESYRNHCIVFGKKISVISNETQKKATAITIDDNCRLLVKYEDGTTEYLSSGEISTKLEDN